MVTVKCEYCGKGIEREDHLRTHIVSKHPEEVDIEESKVCPFCGKEFGSWYRNAMHISYKHKDEIDVLPSDVRERIKEADSRLKKESIAYKNNTVAPKNAIVEITQRCPLNCLHCAVSEKETEELGASKWIEIFNKLHDNGIENLVIEGGEPTIHNDFYEILDYATTLFDNVNVQTSGVTETNFGDFDCNVTISFEYLDPWRNNEIRRMTNPDEWEYERENKIVYKKDKKEKVNKVKKDIMKFRQRGEEEKFQEAQMKLSGMTYNLEERERTYQLALKKAKSIDNPVTIRATIYNDNDILGLAKMAEDIGANSVFLPLKPVGWGEEIREKVPSTKRMREVIKDIWHFNLMSEMSHRVEDPNWYLIKPLWDSFKDVFLQRGKVCGSGNERIFVNYKGGVTPCFLLPDEKMGNLFQDSVKSIFNNIYQWTKEKAKMANERSCDRCMGGCIASMLSNQDKSENSCIWKNFERGD